MRPSRPLPSRHHAFLLAVLAAFLLACLSPALPTVAASDASPTPSAAPAPITVLEDPAGDLAVGTVPAHIGVPEEVYAPVDLRGLALTDTEQNVTFLLRLAHLHDATSLDGPAQFRVTFQSGNVSYTLTIRQQSELAGIYYDAILDRHITATDEDRWLAWTQADLVGDDQVAVTFRRSFLVDQDGAPPFPSRSLTAFRVEAQNMWAGGGSVQTFDTMPDEGVGQVPYPIQAGPQQLGGLSLWSRNPWRSSNGEATTYVFKVEADNKGTGGTFDLFAAGVPANWDVQFPQPTIDLASGAHAEVPVLATVPFAHIHGSEASFIVQLGHPGDDARMGQVRLGVDYPLVPQPAGHHPDLVFHSQRYTMVGGAPYPSSVTRSGSDSGVYMDTVEDEEQPSVAVPGWFWQKDQDDAAYTWWPSVPGFTAGLDFDLTKAIVANVPIESDAPIPGAVLEGWLDYGYRTGDEPWQSVRIATLRSEPMDVPQHGSVLFHLEGLPSADADRLAAHPDSFLEFGLVLDTGRPGADSSFVSPRLAPGGSLHLPLVEYHDAVDEVYSALDGAWLSARGPTTRDVNPGETTLYNLTLHNGPDAGAFHLGFRGSQGAWATVVGGSHVDAQAGASLPVTIALHAPANASAGQAIDLLVEAHGPDGATALLRLGGQVVTAVDLPDEAPLAAHLGHGRASPSPATGLLALALVALALAARGRRS